MSGMIFPEAFTRRTRENGRIDGQPAPLGARSVEDLGKKARTGRIDRIAARHAERDRVITRNVRQEIHAIVIVARGLIKRQLAEERAWVRQRVAFDGDPVLQPRRDLPIIRHHRVRHDADRRTAVDLPEPLDDWTEE